jgi:hypothetical protein
MKSSWRVHLAVLGGYILLSLFITWPLVTQFATALPGEGTDSWQYLWNFWWFDQALFHGQPLYFTNAQYYPLGTSLLFHTLSPLHSLVALPARFLGSYPAAYNWIVLLSTVLSGYGTFLLALEVLRPKETGPGMQTPESDARFAHHASHRPGDSPSPLYLAAFVAGTVFALAPYRSAHLLGHLSLVATETLPFFALFAWRTVRRPGWRPALGVAVTWLAAMLIDWYYPLYMVLLAGFLMLWALGETLLKRRTWGEWLRAGLYLVAALLIAAIVLSPLLLPMLRQSRQAAYLEEPLSFSTTMGADLAAFLLPGPQHPLWGRFFARWTDPFADGNTAEGIVYLGVVALVVAAVGLWRNWRAGGMWAAMAGVFGLLAMGPYLKVLSGNTGIPLPYQVLTWLPIVNFTRVPSRYVVWVQLGLAVLVGLGVMAALRPRRPRALPTGDQPPTPSAGGLRPLPLNSEGSGPPAAGLQPCQSVQGFSAGGPAPLSPPPGACGPRTPSSAHSAEPNQPGAKARMGLRAKAASAKARQKIPNQSPGRYLGVAFVLALILLDYAVMPYPITPAGVPAFYHELAQDNRDYALLELPLQQPASPWYYTKWMLYQTVHGKDSFRGYISRGDPLFNFGGAPFLRQLAGLGERDITYDDWRPLVAAVLSHFRVGYVVLERSRLEGQEEWDRIRQLVQEVLGVDRPAYADAELEAYPVQWETEAGFMFLGNGWHEVEEQSWGPFRWMEQDRSEVYVVSPEAQRMVLSFQAASFLRPRRLEIVQNGQTIGSLEISTALQPYSFTLVLPAGETRLELRADGYDIPREVGAGDDTRAVSVGFSEMRVQVPISKSESRNPKFESADAYRVLWRRKAWRDYDGTD